MRTTNSLALLTDLYQLTMAQTYFQSQRLDPATFSLFIRSYPPNRGYFVAAGLQDVLEFFEQFAVDSTGIDYLHSRRLFADDFLDLLKGLKFTGDVWAIPEGRLAFKDEPFLEVTAPIIEAVVRTTEASQGNILILGVDLTGDRSMRDYTLEGDEEAVSDPLVFLAQPDSVIISREFAARNHLKEDDTLELIAAVARSLRPMVSIRRLKMLSPLPAIST